ncbi:basic proline-rich protein-like [Passer montanus]|uniref:basic proline-rich protein-like n=1 Tax=Passer montanus TaxID=9160 RepID=UPI00195FE882|nr:basic proline-rich protein-like [Passer montanus]
MWVGPIFGVQLLGGGVPQFWGGPCVLGGSPALSGIGGGFPQSCPRFWGVAIFGDPPPRILGDPLMFWGALGVSPVPALLQELQSLSQKYPPPILRGFWDGPNFLGGVPVFGVPPPHWCPHGEGSLPPPPPFWGCHPVFGVVSPFLGGVPIFWGTPLGGSPPHRGPRPGSSVPVAGGSVLVPPVLFRGCHPLFGGVSPFLGDVPIFRGCPRFWGCPHIGVPVPAAPSPWREVQSLSLGCPPAVLGCPPVFGWGCPRSGGVPMSRVSPFGSVPVRDVPVGVSPFRAVPVGVFPCRGVPVGVSPFRSVPIQGCPHWSVPIGVSPFRAVPVGASPFQGVPLGVSPFRGCPRSGGVPMGCPRFRVSPFRGCPRWGVPMKCPHFRVSPFRVSPWGVPIQGCPRSGVSPFWGAPGVSPRGQAHLARAWARRSLKESKRRSSQGWLRMQRCTTSSWPRSSARPSMAVVCGDTGQRQRGGNGWDRVP